MHLYMRCLLSFLLSLRLPLISMPEGATRLSRSLIVTKLLRVSGGHPSHGPAEGGGGRVVTEFILVHPRARVPRPVLPFLLLRLVRRHKYTHV